MKRILLPGQKTKEESQKVIILYSTDAWHSHSSEEMLGIFSDRGKLNEYLQKLSKDVGLTDYDMELLQSINQTQGREANYRISTEKINPKYEK